MPSFGRGGSFRATGVSDECHSSPERELVVGGVVYVCPPPHPLLLLLCKDLLEQEQGALSLEMLSSIVGHAERRGFREAMLSVERFIVQHEKT